MDPDANFEEQCRLLAAMQAGRADGGDAERLRELIVALDDWVRSGGFLPKLFGTGEQAERSKVALHQGRQAIEAL